MNSVSWVRWVVLLGVAAYITFGRGIMLPFLYGSPVTRVDYAVIYGVVIGAILAGIPGFASRLASGWWLRMVPFVLLYTWITFGVFRGEQDSREIFSSMFNMLIGVYLASQVSRQELPALRMCVLFMAGLFIAMCLWYAGDTLDLIRIGWVKGRLGTRFSAGNGVVLPRIMYILVFTCLATLVFDRRLWRKVLCIGLAGIPLMIAFSTGGRGPLLAICMAVLVVLVLLMRQSKVMVVWGALAMGAGVVVAYVVAINYFPVLVERITTGDDSGRWEIWANVLADISLVGRGDMSQLGYAHNIFLELLQDFGIIGLILFVVFLGGVLLRLWRAYRATGDREIAWLIGLVVIQLVSQQFSLHMFFPFFWATLTLPLGLELADAKRGMVSPTPISGGHYDLAAYSPQVGGRA